MHAGRFALTILLAIIMSLGTFTLVGCGGDDQSSQSQASASQGDDEQDNCYGDDLPAVKK